MDNCHFKKQIRKVLLRNESSFCLLFFVVVGCVLDLLTKKARILFLFEI